MKRDVRFLGIDDGPFHRRDRAVRLVGVVTRGPSYIEGVLSDEAEVDGTDATRVLVRMIRRSRFRPTVRCILLNGVAVGGFNVVDLDELHRQVGVPLITLARRRPNGASIRRALQVAFRDWEARWELIRRAEPQPVRNGSYRLYATLRGATLPQAVEFLHGSTTRGAIPEPLRLAHLIASGVAAGESKGRA